jgi:hypothetical protein
MCAFILVHLYILKYEGCEVTWYNHICKLYVEHLWLISLCSDDCEIVNPVKNGLCLRSEMLSP